MADGSHYLCCDVCGDTLDRRPKEDWKDGGTYRQGSARELIERTAALGWTWNGDPFGHQTEHFCPKHIQKS